MIDRLCVKWVLIIAQSSAIMVLLGYLIFKSQWVVVPAFISISLLMSLKCNNCKTSFMDPKIYNHLKLLKFYDTKIIDRCPVCKKAMFN